MPELCEGRMVRPLFSIATLSLAYETPLGTPKNCGRYYDTIMDDYYQVIAMNFITIFDDL
jgi:hypothetical protein